MDKILFILHVITLEFDMMFDVESNVIIQKPEGVSLQVTMRQLEEINDGKSRI